MVSAANTPIPPTGTYCTPVAYKDHVVIVGLQAVVMPSQGCRKGVKVRKISNLSGKTLQEYVIPVNGRKAIWLFTHRIQYTTDNQHWKTLKVY